MAISRREHGRYIVTDGWPATGARALQANEGEELMSTITAPHPASTSTTLPACPWWCTAGPAEHDWQLDHRGTRTGTHSRQVGGFTMSATEWVTADGGSRLDLHPTRVDFLRLDSARRASELSEDLHMVAAILSQIEAGQGQ